MVNHFSIMLQRRLREQERGDEDEDEADKSGKKKKKSGGRGGDLRIHDLEDDLEMSSEDSDGSMGEGNDKESVIHLRYEAVVVSVASATVCLSLCDFTHLVIGQMAKAKQSQRKIQAKEKEKRRSERAMNTRPWKTAMMVTMRV